MKPKTFFMLIIVGLLATTYVNAQESQTKKKMLVVYFSHSGNTEVLAKQIQNLTEAEIFKIEPVNAYPKDYNQCTKQAKQEISDGYKPELKTKLDNIANYDVIFVGFPNWWSTIAPPITTFLSENDLSGKTVVPFITHGGGGIANCFVDVEKLCPNSKVLEGIALPGTRVEGLKKDVEDWIKRTIAE